MIKIRNIQQLIENGETQLNRKARVVALKSFESALKAVDPRQIIESRVSLKNSVLKVNGHSFDFKKLRASQIRQLKSCELYADGVYVCTVTIPSTDYIRVQTEYNAQLSNSIEGKELSEVVCATV